MIKQNKTCEFCGNQFDNNEAIRAYGANSAVVLGCYCSEKCLKADKVATESNNLSDAVLNREKRDWSSVITTKEEEGLQFELAVYRKKDGQILKLSCLDMRGRRFDCSEKTKTVYIRFEDGVLFNYKTELEKYFDSTKIKGTIDALRKKLL